MLKIITNNLADQATLTATNAVAGLGAENLQTDIKGQVCRTSPSTVITATWPTNKTVGAVVIPASNLGPSSTIKVQALDGGGNILWDSGDIYVAPGGILANTDFVEPLNVNTFASGFPPITAVWLPEHKLARSVVVTLSDPDATWIDLARLVIGPVTSCRYGASYGAQTGVIDTSQNTRSASGDLRVDRGVKARRLSFDLGAIIEEDRAKIMRIIDRGVASYMFASLVPTDGDPEKVRDFSIYGKLVNQGSMSYSTYGLYESSFEIEGW